MINLNKLDRILITSVGCINLFSIFVTLIGIFPLLITNCNQIQKINENNIKINRLINEKGLENQEILRDNNRLGQENRKLNLENNRLLELMNNKLKNE